MINIEQSKLVSFTLKTSCLVGVELFEAGYFVFVDLLEK